MVGDRFVIDKKRSAKLEVATKRGRALSVRVPVT
jgi:hypothetical protein